ncbi:hypothetical protein SH139x_004618 [Planctomycetaceae bacterium SH139]
MLTNLFFHGNAHEGAFEMIGVFLFAAGISIYQLPQRRAEHFVRLVRNGDRELLGQLFANEEWTQKPSYTGLVSEISEQCGREHERDQELEPDDVIVDVEPQSFLDYCRGYRRVRVGYTYGKQAVFLLTVYGIHRDYLYEPSCCVQYIDESQP